MKMFAKLQQSCRLPRRWLVALFLVPAAAFAGPAGQPGGRPGPTVVQSSTEYARVVRVMPIRGPDVARQVCRPVSVERRSEHSPGGAILGGIAGAVVGSRFGGGHGRDAATVAGAIGGAMAGDRLGRGAEVETTQECETVYERGEPESYDVTYEYHGERHTVSLDYDPGDRVRLRKTVTVE
jgi:uncharacterized protein YcfJ